MNLGFKGENTDQYYTCLYFLSFITNPICFENVDKTIKDELHVINVISFACSVCKRST